MRKDLIYDDGKFRWCDSNLAKLTVWEYIYFDLQRGNFPQLLQLIWEALLKIFAGALGLITGLLLLFTAPVSLPIIFYIRAKRRIQKAKREVRNSYPVCRCSDPNQCDT